MQNYTSNNRLNQKFGVKNFSENKTTVEVVGRVGINTEDARKPLDVVGQAFFSDNVGIGTINADARVTSDNQVKLAVGIVSAFEYYGDGSNLTGIENVGLANSLSRVGRGELIYQSGDNKTSLLENQGSSGQVLISQGANNPPVFGNAAPAGAVEGFLIFDEGLQVGMGTTFSGLNFVGAAVTVDGTNVGGVATVKINRDFAKVAGFATESGTSGVATDARRINLENNTSSSLSFVAFSTEATGVTTIKTNIDLRFNASTGFLTATRLGGIGSDITELNAANLTGTLPDEIFPNPLPSVSGRNLTELPQGVSVGFANSAGIATEAVTAGIATTAINVRLEDETSDTETFLTFVTAATGDRKLKTNTSLKFNAQDGTLSATKFFGDGSELTNLDPDSLGTISFVTRAGFANSADSLTTARNIFGIPFTGIADTDASGSDGLNVNGDIIEVDNITFRGSTSVIEPKASSSKDRNITIRGNNNTGANGLGGNVIIGELGRGQIRFYSGLGTAYEFFQAGSDNISGSFGFELLSDEQDYDFPDKSGTVALLQDITQGTAGAADKIKVQTRNNNNIDYNITFSQGAGDDQSIFISGSNFTYNAFTDTLKAPNFSGIGSLLTTLDASNVGLGTLNTARLPNVIRIENDITIDAQGEESNLNLDSGRNIFITAGRDTDGTQGGRIIFKGNRGSSSYRFTNTSATSKTANLSFEDILDGSNDTNVTFKLPGDKIGTGNTFAMLDDITGGTAGVAKTAENLKIIGPGNTNANRFPILASSTSGDSKPIVDGELIYNPGDNKLTAGKFAGIGSELTNLKANELKTGKIDTERLPNVYRLDEDITIDANGITGDLNLEAGKNILITAGIDSTTGQIFIEGNRGDRTYRFLNPEDSGNPNTSKRYAALDCTQVLSDSNDGTVFFTLPGNKTGSGNTFAMLNDIIDGTGGVVANSAKKFNDKTVINFSNDVEGKIVFDGGEGSPIGVAITLKGTGNVGFATTSGTAGKVNVLRVNDGGDPSVFLTFVDNDENGDYKLNIDSQLKYNQQTDKLVTDVQGKATSAGIADTATNVDIANANLDGNNSIIIGTGGPTGPQRLRRREFFTYHTPSDTLFVKNIVTSGIITAADFNSTSDIKLKTNIERISDPIEKVLQIDGVSFNWLGNGKPSLGVIADNVQEVLPEIVTDGDPKTVNYNGLIGLLIEAVKEQQSEINSLKERLSKLE